MMVVRDICDCIVWSKTAFEYLHQCTMKEVLPGHIPNIIVIIQSSTCNIDGGRGNARRLLWFNYDYRPLKKKCIEKI